MKLLFITRVDPFQIGGGAFATRAYLDAFIDLSSHVTLMLADCCKIPKSYKDNISFVKVPDRSYLNKIFFPFTGHLHRFSSFFADYWHSLPLGTFDTVVLNGGILGDIAEFLHDKGVRIITLHHNVERHFHLDSKTIESLYGISAFYINKNEKKALLNSSLNLTISEDDQREFRKIYDLSDSVKIEYIGCFEYRGKELISIPSVSRAKKIVITGSLCDYQTKDGIIYFLCELYPLVIRNFPEYNIIIAGRNPSNKIKKICREMAGVELVENPSDMNCIIQQAQLYICPTRLGGGLKLRVMDALRNGVPVIVHSVSAKGYNLFLGKNYFKVYSSEKDFLLALKDLLDTSVKPLTVCRDYLNVFSFEAGKKRVQKLLQL
ncbi:glycosyltransferase [Bacteroides sp. GD17]|jgi:glycosyltransferase involved in cell wall biosynthesis|uniref:glycosyltransferase n=1 Tax=Bacteroides sp. GD17 TaxID=3139826 RepID=UPI00313F27AE